MSVHEKQDVDNVKIEQGVCNMPNKAVAMRLLLDVIENNPNKHSSLQAARATKIRETPFWYEDLKKHGYNTERSISMFLNLIFQPSEFKIEWANAKVKGPTKQNNVYVLVLKRGIDQLKFVDEKTTLDDYFTLEYSEKGRKKDWENFHLESTYICIDKERLHAITGYICGDDAFLYDSNMKKPIKADWRSGNLNEILRKHPKAKRIKNAIFRVLVFVRD